MLLIEKLKMSEDGIVNIKCRLLKMFAELDDCELDVIEHWISSQSYKKGYVYLFKTKLLISIISDNDITLVLSLIPCTVTSVKPAQLRSTKAQ